MNTFKYVSARTPEEAVSLIGKNGRYLGGGIDLLGEMKEYIVSPDVLVDVKHIAGDSKVRKDPKPEPNAVVSSDISVVYKGDMTIAQIAAEAGSLWAGVAEAASEVGSPQIRNVATLAGNLLQHSRCWYYRQPDITCLKRGGTTCYGEAGENKYLSLFSGCACLSPVVSNLAVMLTALDTQIALATRSEMLPIEKLYDDAWKDPLAHHSLKPQEFLTNVAIPTRRSRSAYRQVSEKREFDWALVSCGAAANINEGKLSQVRVVLGAVAPVPYMVEEANKFLEGKSLNDETASKAADIILRDAKPLAQNGYKIPLAHTLIRRTLLALNP